MFHDQICPGGENQELQIERDRLLARLRLQIDRLPLAYLLLDSSYHVLDWNPAAEAIFGYSKEEAVGRLCMDLINLAPLDERLQNIIRRLSAGDMSAHSVNENRTKDGRMIVCEWFNTPLREEDGHFGGVISVVQDITEKKRREDEWMRQKEQAALQFAELEQIYRYAPVGLAFLDRDLRYVRINENLAAMNGLPVAEHLGRTIWQIIPEIADTIEPHFRRAIASGVPIQNMEVRGSTAAEPGVERDWLESYCPLLSAEGAVVGVTAAVVEITDRKRAEEKLREYSERVQALSRRLLTVQEEDRRHLARELHDEIGQALSAIGINLQGVVEVCDDSARSRLEESSRIVDDAIQRVRNLSLDLRPSMLDDLGLISTLRWYADRQAQRSGFLLHFNAQSSCARLPADVETACYRVVQEALTNVVRHARARQVWLDYTEDEREVRLVIRDNGVGFDTAAVRQRILEGASFGVLGMQERVTLLGGRFEIDSIPAQGTTILLRVPVELQLPRSQSDMSSSE